MTKLKSTSINRRKSSLRFESSESHLAQMDVRRRRVEELTVTNLSAISAPSFSVDTVSTKNCENLIGKTEVPLGIAGPLKVRGDFAEGDFYIPLATTEGALVASVNRGCKAIMESGGAKTFIENHGITRAPVFRTQGIDQTKKLLDFTEKRIRLLEKLVASVDSHIKLTSVKTYTAGRNLFLRLTFDTGDAMGMNMATIASEKVAGYIEEHLGVSCLALSGNVCADKKPSWLNKIMQRGYSIHSEVLIPARVIKKVLKADPDKVVAVHIAKNLVGTIVAGSVGANAHVANVTAAMFLATGQDAAHVVETSTATTSVEKSGKDLYFSLYLPDLPLGTVGGGTGLATQSAALNIMGVAGGGNPTGSNAKKLAEIVASACLAGEISLLSALAAGHLAQAHRIFGRGERS